MLVGWSGLKTVLVVHSVQIQGVYIEVVALAVAFQEKADGEECVE